MRVKFVQSGGFLGMVKGCELDTKALSPEAAKELKRLVTDSGFTSSFEALSTKARDLAQYEITIIDSKRKVSVLLDAATVPSAAKPLIGHLKQQARPQPVDF